MVTNPGGFNFSFVFYVFNLSNIRLMRFESLSCFYSYLMSSRKCRYNPGKNYCGQRGRNSCRLPNKNINFQLPLPPPPPPSRSMLKAYKIRTFIIIIIIVKQKPICSYKAELLGLHHLKYDL